MPVAEEGDTALVNVTICPNVEGFRLAERLVVVLLLVTTGFTFCVRIAEVLPLSLLSPLKLAVTEWLLATRLEVVKVALPLLRIELPSVEDPSRNVTEPVAVEGVTAAVNVTDCPAGDGLKLEVTTTVVLALFAVTVCETEPEMLFVSLLSPL